MRLIVLILVGLLATVVNVLGQECDPVDLATVSLPVPNVYNAEVRRHHEQLLQPPSDTVFIGDSMVRRWPSDLPQPIPQLANAAFFGLEADKTQNTLWRLEDIARAQPEARRLILWLGTNNLSNFEKACAVEAGLELVIGEAHRLWPAAGLVVLGIAPRGPGLQWREVERQAVNSFLAESQMRLGFQFVDVTALRCPSLPGFDPARLPLDERLAFACPNYLPDLLHLTVSGYARLTAILGPRL